ncbi:AzlC family ABC transporter permease [Aquabacterium sp. A7-Y]|uniref:AzlC family ABC transporter permease n=1 Tax=Aquabacterium sp. A7-Y TaxID=1349605 RepID=UPI00223E1D47|nr:AzlC family ABC transporter permease [Aquabacterium sp. A7-Y]MCW7539578.1 AzlC family ABC transporter permease [Aquabacterium sp. A7-Y]
MSSRCTHPPPPLADHGRAQFYLGARRCLPLAVSVAAYGLVWGVLAGQAGVSLLQTGLMSALVFAGSAQFVALDMWQTSGASPPVLAILVATLVVNLRFFLMTAALHPMFVREGSRWPLLKAFLISDENWALTSAELSEGRGSVAFLLGGGVLTYLAWLTATLTGRLAGELLGDPARWALDFAFTATFLALLVAMWRGPGSLLPWTVASLAALAAHALLPGKWYIIIGGLLGSLAGAVRRPEEERPA